MYQVQPFADLLRHFGSAHPEHSTISSTGQVKGKLAGSVGHQRRALLARHDRGKRTGQGHQASKIFTGSAHLGVTGQALSDEDDRDATAEREFSPTG
ncbi:hypothetical protein GCM10011609_63960 [Lentzea pudingi]|uniref:Uncharacterized protein n=1 Tax=Lentzea pudingi TaxID=1789439 RepID=A0ABQ2IN75_9PSEU|nr:hypothetical protein GCM10011609_63960 [Lentzea pudingi]